MGNLLQVARRKIRALGKASNVSRMGWENPELSERIKVEREQLHRVEQWLAGYTGGDRKRREKWMVMACLEFTCPTCEIVSHDTRRWSIQIAEDSACCLKCYMAGERVPFLERFWANIPDPQM